MKHGTKPTRNQKLFLKKWKLNPADWLVERETPSEMVLIHRHFDTKKTLPKRRYDDE